MEATNGHTNGEAPLNGHTNGEAPLNGHTNGEAALNGQTNGHTNGHAAPAVPEVSAPAPAPENGSAHVEPEITRVRGPLGLASASLAGKVALVTGSGM
jgi:tetrahydroxynaphthalene reductase